MRDQGMKDAVMISGDAFVTQEFWSITGPAGEGTMMTFSPDPRKAPTAVDLVKRFRDAKIEPEGYVLYTYAAVQAWKAAVEAAKTTEKNAVIKALNELEFKTVLGNLKFDKKGDPSLPPYAFYKWSAGKYEQIN